MIDPEMFAAIIKELGYLDEDEKDELKSESEKSMHEPSEESKKEKPSKS